MNHRNLIQGALAFVVVLGLAPVAQARQAAPGMQVTPASGYYSSGPQGGPFNPGVQIFTMTNTTGSPINFTCTADQPWVSIFMPSGTVPANQGWANPIFIANAANTLTPGTYTSTVTFTNTSGTGGNTTRTVTLIVGTPGDTTPPSVTITSPTPPNASSNTTPLTISGTASDNVSVASMYWVNMLTNESGTMPGAAAWTFSVGLVNGQNLINVLAWDGAGNQGTTSITIQYPAAAGGQLSVTPATGFTSTGPAGGPFSPLQQVYSVSNTGGSSINFTATATQPWVNVLGGSGALAAGASTNVVLSFTAAANALAAGTYNDTVTFTNTTNAQGNATRAVSLVIGSSSDTTPPSITIVNPAPPTASASSGPITISGTASDNVGVTSISWQNLEALQSGTVPGGTSWSISAPLVSGTNTITITAHDAGGNSTPATIVVTMGASVSAPAPSGGKKGGGCLGSTAVGGSGALWMLGFGALLLGAALKRR